MSIANEANISHSSRLRCAAWIAFAVAGLIVGWGKGQLPRSAPVATDPPAAATSAPDLQLYREVIADVRQGADYYDTARAKLPQVGFPLRSPLNWRLPTYAWLFARLPSDAWVRALLIGLSLIGLTLAFIAAKRRWGVAAGVACLLLQVGVVRWSLDGDAFLAQEVWAATLILISISAHALGWRTIAIVAGCSALMFRELALPYCGVAAIVALQERRWREVAGWAAVIALFGALLAWHVSQVQAQLSGLGEAGATDLSQWLRWGGLDFVLLTERMNGLLFAAPAAVLWLYLFVAMLGLASQTDSTSRVAALAAAAYLFAFAIIGRPENFYWGLLYAPLLPIGVVNLIGEVKCLRLPNVGDAAGWEGEAPAEPGAASLG